MDGQRRFGSFRVGEVRRGTGEDCAGGGKISIQEREQELYANVNRRILAAPKNPIEYAAHKEHAIHNLNRQPVQVITRTEAIRWAHWSFAESQHRPILLLFSNKSAFPALFYSNSALDLMTTSLKMRRWLNSIRAIAFHARVPTSGLGVVKNAPAKENPRRTRRGSSEAGARM